MTTYNVIVNEEIIDTITVADIDTLDGYQLPSVQCKLVKIN
jgi:hypothetical protein|tara:strand:+ start:749 stop:871 length:123 start_codon:yes stop_codon:yes gene_type:complete